MLLGSQAKISNSITIEQQNFHYRLSLNPMDYIVRSSLRKSPCCLCIKRKCDTKKEEDKKRRKRLLKERKLLLLRHITFSGNESSTLWSWSTILVFFWARESLRTRMKTRLSFQISLLRPITTLMLCWLLHLFYLYTALFNYELNKVLYLIQDDYKVLILIWTLRKSIKNFSKINAFDKFQSRWRK